MDYIIFGAGGHAKVVLDMLRANGDRILGVMDDRLESKEWNGLKVLGNLKSLEKEENPNIGALFIIAIGQNESRKKVADFLEGKGAKFGTVIHPSAIVGSNCSIGAGTVIMPNAVINADTAIGRHVIINTSSSVDHDCLIHDFAHISPGAHLAGGVSVGTGAHVGIGANVIPGIKIGNETVVGAGAAVINDLPDRVTAVGVPAVIKKQRDEANV
ncbi:putative acetyltransferase EpsM [compost metagenome]